MATSVVLIITICSDLRKRSYFQWDVVEFKPGGITRRQKQVQDSRACTVVGNPKSRLSMPSAPQLNVHLVAWTYLLWHPKTWKPTFHDRAHSTGSSKNSSVCVRILTTIAKKLQRVLCLRISGSACQTNNVQKTETKTPKKLWKRITWK